VVTFEHDLLDVGDDLFAVSFRDTVAAGNVIYVGTEDARVLRVDADGALELLRGFDARRLA